MTVRDELKQMVENGEPVTDYQVGVYIDDILKIIKGHCPYCEIASSVNGKMTVRGRVCDDALTAELDKIPE